MEKDAWAVHNYCVTFIDILGQRSAYANEGLLPRFASEEEKQAFWGKVKQTIGSIRDLQESADAMIKELLSPQSSTREMLPEDLRSTYAQMQLAKVTRQRWSDGLVFYTSLADTEMKCPMNNLLNMFATAGCLCFLGLSKCRPLRGAIDIAWAVELHEGELYGAALAKAYEYESLIAQYPRIVVSERTIGYLEAFRRNPDTNVFIQYNRALAGLCLSMLEQDADGYFFLHYLGDEFRAAVSKELHPYLYDRALKFIQAEGDRIRQDREVKLALRYNHLHSYFLSHPPAERNIDEAAPNGRE
jgi:hypothetical protein